MPLVDKIREWFSDGQPSHETRPPSPPAALASTPVSAPRKVVAASVPPLATENAAPKIAPAEKVSPPIASPAPVIIQPAQAPAVFAEANILTQALGEESGSTGPAMTDASSPYEDALQSLQNADTIEERSTVLLSHPFFTEGAGKDKQGFDAKMMVEILKHLSDVHSELGHQMWHQGHFSIQAQKKETQPQSWILTSWLDMRHGLGWIERVTELAQQEPHCKELLRPHVHKLFAIWDSKHSDVWPDIAEQVLASWAPVSPRLLIAGLYHMHEEERQKNRPLEKYSNLAAFWNNPEYDVDWLQWSGYGNEDAFRIINRHPRLNTWDLVESYHAGRGDRGYIDEKIKKIAEQDKAGALIKAWYGYELTVEEITKHPLAHSLYVHKHAPMYLEEVLPLPDSWNVALTLAQTGREFCDMLVMTAKAKMSKEPVHAVELPDLGPELH